MTLTIKSITPEPFGSGQYAAVLIPADGGPLVTLQTANPKIYAGMIEGGSVELNVRPPLMGKP